MLRHWSQLVPNMSTRHLRTLSNTTYLGLGWGLLWGHWFWKSGTDSLKGGCSSFILTEVIPVLDCVGGEKWEFPVVSMTGGHWVWEWWALPDLFNFNQINLAYNVYCIHAEKQAYMWCTGVKQSWFFVCRCSLCCYLAGKASCGYKSGMQRTLTRQRRRLCESWWPLFCPASQRCVAFWNGRNSKLSTKGIVLRVFWLFFDCCYCCSCI